jgi:hypothetical protein
MGTLGLGSAIGTKDSWAGHLRAGLSYRYICRMISLVTFRLGSAKDSEDNTGLVTLGWAQIKIQRRIELVTLKVHMHEIFIVCF